MITKKGPYGEPGVISFHQNRDDEAGNIRELSPVKGSGLIQVLFLSHEKKDLPQVNRSAELIMSHPEYNSPLNIFPGTILPSG